MVPQDLFRKANDICMGVSDLPSAKSSGLSEKVIKDDLRLQVIKLKSTTCQAMEEGMKDYYLYGSEMGCQSGYTYNRGENMCVNNSNAEDKVEPTEVSTDFASAKKNCDTFEQALMSTRDNMYAKFEDGMVNYLSDHVAKLIKKQAKDTKTVAQAFNTLKTTDADIEVSNIETEANIVTSKANAEASKTKSIAKAELAKVEAETEAAKAETAKVKAQAENIKAYKNAIEALKDKIPDLCEYKGERTIYLTQNAGKYNMSTDSTNSLYSIKCGDKYAMNLIAEARKAQAEGTKAVAKAEVEMAKADSEKATALAEVQRQKNIAACKGKTLGVWYGFAGDNNDWYWGYLNEQRGKFINLGMGSYACSNSTFGDTLRGIRKYCWCKQYVSSCGSNIKSDVDRTSDKGIDRGRGSYVEQESDTKMCYTYKKIVEEGSGSITIACNPSTGELFCQGG